MNTFEYFNLDDIKKALKSDIRVFDDSIINQVIAFMLEFDTYGFWDCFGNPFADIDDFEYELARYEAIFLLTEIEELTEQIEYYEQETLKA